jgi:tetratricopeptide (TPR) repeat protein
MRNRIVQQFNPCYWRFAPIPSAKASGLSTIWRAPVDRFRPIVFHRGLSASTVAWPLLVLPAFAQAQALCEPPDARLVSIQGTVELKRAGTDVWTAAMLEEAFCKGDTLRTGAASRAGLALANDATLRVDQDTTAQLRASAEEGRSLLNLLVGAIYFFSHRPRALEVDTPFVNAAAEGTEFLVRVGADRAEVVMLDGQVLLQNPQGELRIASGQAAVIPAGIAPAPMIVARPRDAVAWALYYPPILVELAGGGAPPRALPPGLQAAIERIAANDYAGALQALETVPERARDARYYTYRAGVLLNVGRVDEAAAAIQRALTLDPEAGDALAQRAIIQVVQNRRQEALADARRAVELRPESSAARIALSYALQANFRLEEARAVLREAVERNPEDALAWARLAELELMFGEFDANRDAAERAVALAPELARTQMVLGFAALARIDIDQAKTSFERAIALDSANPLPRLGLGLAIIRSGNLNAGGRQIEIAAALDPNDSLIRSYLGKAYFEEKRGPLDAEQFAIAKELDPNDPTPWFYDAIRLQTINRPVEALRDLQTSIRLNDNRAVYRSRLLLDEDLAVRGARSGRIYNDLGFEQMGLLEGWRSVTRDPANFSAHRLLADLYATLPRHNIAQDSELLQSQLLQPINIDPVQPRLADNRLTFLRDTAPTGVAFNEFTRLFTRNELLRIQADTIAGSDDTFAGNYIGSGIHNRISYSAGYFHFDTDGIRTNDDFTQDIATAFLQASPSPRLGLQTEFRYVDEASGDRNLFFDPNNFSPTNRADRTINSFRLSSRQDILADTTVLANYSYLDADAHGRFPSQGVKASADETDNSIELRAIHRQNWLNINAGFGYLKGDTSMVVNSIGSGRELQRAESDLKQGNVYTYADIRVPMSALVTVGASFDSLDATGFGVEKAQINPKLGLLWEFHPGTTFRAAVFRTLKRTFVSSKTLEPTFVAGFNQFFDGLNATQAWRYGVALDHVVSDSAFAGVEFTQSELDVPRLTPTAESDDFDATESFARGYFYWTPSKLLAFSAEYQFEEFDVEQEVSTAAIEKLRTHRIPLGARFFHPSGLFASVEGIYVNQDGRFENIFGGEPRSDREDFWIVNAGIGYRFPKRYGFLALNVENAFDENFNFQDTEPSNPRISFGRAIFGRLMVTF